MQQTEWMLKNQSQSQSISERNKNETFLEVIIIKAMVKDFMISPFEILYSIGIYVSILW